MKIEQAAFFIRFQKLHPDWAEESSSLSLNKRLCMFYLKFKVYGRKKDKFNFVEFASVCYKARKFRGTIVMRRAQRYFAAHSKMKRAVGAQQENVNNAIKKAQEGGGSHAPGIKEARHRKFGSTFKDTNTRWWILVKPDGTETKFLNLAKFCRENNFNTRDLHLTITRGTKVRGYSLRRCDDPVKRDADGNLIYESENPLDGLQN
jgi:hypothetical protein